jgi:hypothetical protein
VVLVHFAAQRRRSNVSGETVKSSLTDAGESSQIETIAAGLPGPLPEIARQIDSEFAQHLCVLTGDVEQGVRDGRHGLARHIVTHNRVDLDVEEASRGRCQIET